MIVVEDQNAIRGILVAMVRNSLGWDVVGEAGNGQVALDLILEKKPDMVLLDAKLEGISGVEVLRRARRHIPELKAMVFTGVEGPNLVREMVRAGAMGFVEKSADIEDLKRGLAVISQGGTFFSPHVTKMLREALSKPPEQPAIEDVLSDREIVVLKLIATSHSTKEIAEKLGISVKTADNHRTNLMRKLSLHDVAALTRFAIQRKLIAME